MMTKEAMKLALEALEGIHPGNMTPMAEEYWNKAITALREALAEPQEKYQYGTPLLDAMRGKANETLDKMAENARELGMDYEHPAQKPVALPEKIYEFVPTPEPAKWHHPECEGECIACLIERVVQEAYGSQGLSYLQRHLTSPPAQRKPLTHEQRVDLLAKFEAHKHEWHAPAILIDMVEAAHGIKGDA